MPVSTKKARDTKLFLRVLGREIERGRWSAHCLETDIVGYGRTFDAALCELLELTEMQISFAIFKKQPALLDRPAPAEVFELYNAVHREQMTELDTTKRKRRNRVVTSVPLPQPSSRSGFSIAQG
jgi:hypothetical protein